MYEALKLYCIRLSAYIRNSFFPNNIFLILATGHSQFLTNSQLQMNKMDMQVIQQVVADYTSVTSPNYKNVTKTG